MTTELKQAAQDAAEAIDWLLKNIRRDAPQLSGKAMGNAEKCASALRAALSQQPDNTACKSVQKRLEAQQPATGEPVAWAVYRPSLPCQEFYDDQDDPGYIDILTNEPDAEVTPLSTHPAPSVPHNDDQHSHGSAQDPQDTYANGLAQANNEQD